jgi:hypothetical protein
MINRTHRHARARRPPAAKSVPDKQCAVDERKAAYQGATVRRLDAVSCELGPTLDSVLRRHGDA